MPAFDPAQRRLVLPLMLSIPFLFVAGVLFGYFVVLPAAVRFFQNFNSAQFNVLVQASQYYKFAATTLLAMGLLFQVPVGIMAVTRAGIITPRQLRKNRRYAIVACGAVAALLPGDAVTLLLETVPLYLLFELGVLLATSPSAARAHRAGPRDESRGRTAGPELGAGRIPRRVSGWTPTGGRRRAPRVGRCARRRRSGREPPARTRRRDHSGAVRAATDRIDRA